MTFHRTLHFCTLFDSTYLTRGLALYRSLCAHNTDFRLYVYCFDDEAYDILKHLALPGLVLISLKEFENPDLLAVKEERTRGEYCWTCTSHIIRDALERFSLDEVTYLDADLYFFADPNLLIEEFREAGSSVLITEHRYTSRYDQSASSGTYCVQFMTFANDECGRRVLDWWCDRTLEWCYNRHEDGKFGDQKYLDDWTTRFSGVHVLRHTGGGVAPWNVQQHSITKGPLIDGEPVVFYHFHNLTWYDDDTFMLDRYRLTRSVVDELYRPYVGALKAERKVVQTCAPGFNKGTRPLPEHRPPFWVTIEHRLKGKFHVIR